MIFYNVEKQIRNICQVEQKKENNSEKLKTNHLCYFFIKTLIILQIQQILSDQNHYSAWVIFEQETQLKWFALKEGTYLIIAAIICHNNELSLNLNLTWLYFLQIDSEYFILLAESNQTVLKTYFKSLNFHASNSTLSEISTNSNSIHLCGR